MRIIDISIPIDDNLPVWPGNVRPKIERVADMREGKKYNESILEMNAHAGTHLDAPLHFIRDGKTIDQMNLDVFIGPVYVADMTHVKEITADELEKAKIPNTIRKVLFKTINSSFWGTKKAEFQKEYVGLTIDAARWLMERNMDLVGNDYLSVAKFEEALGVHNMLFEKGTVLLEGITLHNVEEGVYKLICFPIKIDGVEAAPTRAMLIEE